MFRQGQRASAIFAIETGSIRLERSLRDGSTVVLHTARAGETFAEASFNADHYHCDAVAESDSLVWVLDSAVLRSGDHYAGLHRTLNALLANQVRELRTLVSLRDIRSAEERLLAWFRLHASPRGNEFVLSQTWTVVAQQIGLTRESVYRALAKLSRDGVIERTIDPGDVAQERLRLL